jgi:hypothetical protein
MASAIGAVLALLLAVMCPLSAGAKPLSPEGDGPVLGEQLGGAVQDTIRPAYRFVEGISDGVYDFVRLQVIGNILPERMTSNLYAAPRQDSAALLDKNLSEKEARFLQRAREAYPIAGDKAGSVEQAPLQQWRSWAAAEQLSVSVDALKDTLLQRYGLDFFGRSSEAYAKDRRNWDPGFLTMAGLVSGALLYLNGMHATAPLGDLRLGIDLSSGLRVQRAMQSGGAGRRLGGLELGYKGQPLALAADWGVDNERLRGESVGLKYRLQF